MNSFFPFDMFVTQAKVFNIFWKISVDVLDEHRKHQEAELQRVLLETIGGGKHTDASERILLRIDHIAAAVRAFLDHNKPLTFCSSNPIVRELELALARKFVLLFQKMEREVRHTTPHIPLKKWRDENFRTELGKMVSKDPAVFGKFVLESAFPTSERKHIAEQISGQLMCGHKQNEASHQQMG